VFCVIMGSSDFVDAFEKLTKLQLKGRQERDIVRVLVECCAQVPTVAPSLSWPRIPWKLTTHATAP
jgi:NADH:ubiquinone oxidoreductase subunit E